MTPKEKPKPKKEKSSTFSKLNEADKIWWTAFGVVILLTACTRYYKIGEPDHVCWDETHFGKMGSWYINQTFFFDVHPPLGKMLIGLSGKLTGYNGTFAFGKPGDKYGDHNYVGMRLFCVTLGASIVPFGFVTVWELTQSIKAAILAALFLIFDVGLITISQYILLDPILMCFIFGSMMGMAKFRSQHEKPFSRSWWFWLGWTGTFMACSISVKFVGLFIVLVVGAYTIVDLWIMLGNLEMPLITLAKHFVARALTLILLPLILYMIFFYIHLRTLSKSGSGDGFFSSAFQSQLEGNSLFNYSVPREVAYGAVLTLKNQRTGGGYLHSHWHLYPEGVGARQQQITAYSHKDDNNKWVIKKYDRQPDAKEDPIELVRNGDLIRLEHYVTTRNLHGHKEVAPITKKHYQVTCYGENGTGDTNDVWKLEVVGGGEKATVQTVTSRVKLIHYFTNCALHSHSKQLPKWGFDQMEVSCNPNLRDKNNLWNVEDNYFPKLPNVTFDVYAPNFLEKFLESHAVMFQGNAGLKPKEGEVTSKPWHWPVNLRGQFFSGFEYTIYLLGNPIIWWGNLVFLVIYVIFQIKESILLQRGCTIETKRAAFNSQTSIACGWLLLAWALHYLPFYSMSRVLYFHHYFPALIFNSMLSAVILDYLFETLLHIISKPIGVTIYHSLYALLFSAIFYSFYLFQPLSYGIRKTSADNSTMDSLKWLTTWEF